MTKSRTFWSKLEGKALDNRYFLNKLLGTGGFGAVYFTDEVVRDRVIRQLAVKLIELDEDNPETQLEELIAATNIEHPHLLRCFASGECELLNEDFLYLLMELAQTSLEKQIETGKLSEKEVKQLINEVASALVYLHDKKITHRDLKPGNILKVGDKWKLSDFGLVRKLQKSSVTMTSTLLGSAGYAPPEAYDGQISTSWDIWSLGVIIVEAFTGELPFKADTPLKLIKQVTDGKPDLSQLPPTLKELVEACLQKERKTRPTAQQVLDWFSPPPLPKESLGVSTPPLPKESLEVSTPPLNKGGLGGVQPVSQQVLDWVSPTLQTSSSQPKTQTPPSQPKTQTPPSQPKTQTPPLNKGGLGGVQIPLKTFTFEIVTVDKYGKINNRRPGKAEYFTLNLPKGVTMDLVSIPGGKFLMGAPASEQGSSDSERPQHWVTVPPFFLGKYQVTQAQWEAVMGNNPSCFKGPNRPVECVSWDDCVNFCKELTQLTQKNVRLPSEAEWEYACRAETTTPFNFGETITPDLANYNGNSPYSSGPKGVDRKATTDVGIFPPNAFGLYDMHGNVWEWCQDGWHDNYQNAPENGAAWDGDYSRVILRGGVHYRDAAYCRSSYRFSGSRDTSNFIYGFRIAVCFPRTP